MSGQYGGLYIPKIPPHHIAYPNGHNIPVVPLLVLLILKVQGWRDRLRKSRFSEKARRKVLLDKGDTDRLLEMTDDSDHLDYFSQYPKWFLRRAKGLVRRYTKKYPNKAYLFRQLGFDV